MPVEHLSKFVPDCSKAEQQILWLQSLRTTRDERLSAAVNIQAFGFLTNDYQNRKDTANGLQNWWVDTNIREVYKKCAA